MSKLNKQKAGAGYLFALLLSVILLGSQVKGHYQQDDGKQTFRVDLEEPNKELLIIFLPLIALSLGIEVDKYALIRMLLPALKAAEKRERLEELDVEEFEKRGKEDDQQE